MKKTILSCLTNSFFTACILLLSSNSLSAQNSLNNTGLTSSTPAGAAYSLRLLSSGYTGKAVNVRRSSDNTTVDVGFVGGNLDTAALKTFVGTGNGFVAKWYDQSGNGRDELQATTWLQPTIVTSGTINRSNGLPSLYFNGTTVYMQTASVASWLNNTSYSISSVAQTSGKTTDYLIAVGQNSADSGFSFGHSLTTNISLTQAGTSNAYFAVSNFSTSLSLRSVVKLSDAGSSMYYNNSCLGVSTMPANNIFTTSGRLNLGCGQLTAAYFWVGNISEVVIFSSDITASRPTLELNQFQYYNMASVLNIPFITNQPSPSIQTICINTSATPLAVTATGTSLSYQWYRNTSNNTVGGTLISGATSSSFTPPTTAAGTSYYYVVVSNGTNTTTSTCGIVSVIANGAISLNSGSTAQSICTNTALANIKYNITGTATGATVTGLPTGVTGAYIAGIYTLSGTPTQSGVFPYTVTTTGSTCVNPSMTGTITSNGGTLALTTGSASNSVCTGSSTNIQYTVGGTATGATLTGSLPAGVTGSFSAGKFTITGTPTLTGTATVTYTYTVTTTGATCTNASLTGNISVTPLPTISLNSGSTAQTICVNNPIGNISYNIGGSATGATVTGLPSGVTGIFSAGIFTISGTPTQVGTFPFTVRTTGPVCTSVTLTGTITTIANGTISLNYGPTSQTICSGSSISPTGFNIGGTATGATFTGLPTGVTGVYSGGLAQIIGTPTVVGTSPTQYIITITTTGSSCVNPSAKDTIIVKPNATISLASGPTKQTLCINTPLTPIVCNVGGSATGAQANSFPNSLPTGLTGSYNAGVFTLSGTPTQAGKFYYYIGTTGSGCTNAYIYDTITVLDNATFYRINGDIPITDTAYWSDQPGLHRYGFGGATTGAVFTGFPKNVTTNIYSFGSVQNGTFGTAIYATGSSSDDNIPITTPKQYNYTLTASGSSCYNQTITGTLTVLPLAYIKLSSAVGTNSQTVNYYSSISPITYSISGSATGGAVTGLPSGVTYSYSNGVLTISGTPNGLPGTYTYFARATGEGDFRTDYSQTYGTIVVNPAPVTFGTFTLPDPGPTMTLTAPSSPSAGAIKYISSDTNVATISGNIVTIKGGGPLTITVTQAKNGIYDSAFTSASTTIVPVAPTFGSFSIPSQKLGDNTNLGQYANAFTITPPSSNSNGAFTFASSDPTIAHISLGAYYYSTNVLIFNIPPGSLECFSEGTVTITATQAASGYYAARSITTTFTVLPNRPIINISDASISASTLTFTPSPSSNSTGSFSYISSDTTVAKVNGNKLNIVGAGLATITVNQAAVEGKYSSASTTFQLGVNLANPTYGSWSSINKTYGDTAFTISKPVSNSNSAFAYTSSNTDVATISGNQIIIKGAGTTTITASQSANSAFSAGSTTTTLTVNKATLTIRGLDVTVNYGTKENDVAYKYTISGFKLNDDSSVISGTIYPYSNYYSFLNASTANVSIMPGIDGLVAANYTFIPVPGVITIVKDTLHLNGYSLIKSYADYTFILDSPNSPSNGAFTYSSNDTNLIKISGSTVRIFGVGTAKITATQAASNNYFSSSASIDVTVYSSAPIISPIADLTKYYGDSSFKLVSPASTSNAAFTYTSSNPAVATVVGNTVSIISVGTTTITAVQDPTNNYVSGSTSFVLTVNQVPATIDSLNIPSCISRNISFTNPISNSTGEITYTSSDSTVAFVDSQSGLNNNIVPLNKGTAIITLHQAADANHSATTISKEITVKLRPIVRLITDASDTINNQFPFAKTICKGSSLIFTAVTFNVDNISQAIYTFFVNGVSVQTGASNTYTSSSLNDGDVVKCTMAVDDNCSVFTNSGSNTIKVTVTQPVTPSITLNTTDATMCSNLKHSVTVSADTANAGVSPTFNFMLNGSSVQNGSSTTYTLADPHINDAITCIMTTANTCQTASTTTSAPLAITVNTPIAPIITAVGSNQLCAGDSIVLTTTTTANQWIRNGSALPAITSPSYTASLYGTYSVYGTDVNGCSSTSLPYVVNQVFVPAPTITAVDNVLTTSSVSGGTQWYKNLNTALGTGNTQTIDTSVVAFYSAQTIVNGCKSPMSNYIVNTRDSVNSINENCPTTNAPALFSNNTPKAKQASTLLLTYEGASLGVRVFPNPSGSNAYVQISGATDVSDIAVSDALGRIVWRGTVGNNKAISLPAGTLAKGVYLVTVTNEGQRQEAKWIINR